MLDFVCVLEDVAQLTSAIDAHTPCVIAGLHDPNVVCPVDLPILWKQCLQVFVKSHDFKLLVGREADFWNTLLKQLGLKLDHLLDLTVLEPHGRLCTVKAPLFGLFVTERVAEGFREGIGVANLTHAE